MKKKMFFLATAYIGGVVAALLYNKKSSDEMKSDLSLAKTGKEKFNVFYNSVLELHKNILSGILSDKNKELIENKKQEVTKLVEEYKKDGEKLFEEIKEKGSDYIEEGTKKLDKLYQTNLSKMDSLREKMPNNLEELKLKLDEYFTDIKNKIKKI